MNDPTNTRQSGTEQSDSSSDEALTIVFDGECPVCTAYSCTINFDRPAALVNARKGGDTVDAILQSGLDLDEGMVVVQGGKYFHGADAVHLLALHSTAPGFFNRLNHVIFRSRRRARLLYPFLRAGRNTLLRLLGRSKIGSSSH